MGYICHHAIIVTGFDDELVNKARQAALMLGLPATEIINSLINSYFTFLVGPDGSKEGWEMSEEGDLARKSFIQWLEERRYEDNSSPLDWAYVQYGDEDNDNKLLDDSGRVIREEGYR